MASHQKMLNRPSHDSRLYHYVRDSMRQAANELIPFDEAYKATDWSQYKDMPAFDGSNRGNAYRIYLEMEAEAFD